MKSFAAIHLRFIVTHLPGAAGCAEQARENALERLTLAGERDILREESKKPKQNRAQNEFDKESGP
ncbi:MAG: hypothetical protein IJV58_03025 [Oscillospiraceae bacterium]|nr:hypothetical protein [Oscillospiraceae bacterium]MBQ9695380.1 hypothetical protein [Oscillospiraceae bacterium]